MKTINLFKYIHYNFIVSKLETKRNDKAFLLDNFRHKETELQNILANKNQDYMKYNIEINVSKLNDLEKKQLEVLHQNAQKQLTKVQTYIEKLKKEIKILDNKIEKYTIKRNKYSEKSVEKYKEL